MGRLESEVRPENPHYFWLEPSSQREPDMVAKRYPGVRILNNEELLAINKLSAVWVETVDTRIGMIVRLYLFWGVRGRKVWVRGTCGFDDGRLKSQLASLPEFSKLFKQWRNSADLSKETIKAYEVGEQISESELPEFIKPHVLQAKVWGEAVNELWTGFSYSYNSEITRDGYYAAPLSIHPFSFLLEKWRDIYVDDAGYTEEGSWLQRLRREVWPPAIMPEDIRWVDEDKKMTLVLRHAETHPDIVEYYGYRKMLVQYLSGQSPERLKRWQAELVQKSART